MAQTPQTTSMEQLTDTIRRTIRVFGAQPIHTSSPADILGAARLLHGRLSRSGIPTRWIDGDYQTPLLVAGNGPVAVATYLDDNHPGAAGVASTPPEIKNSVIHGIALERKAAIVAHLAALLTDPALASRMTLLVETDRQSGSHTLEQWLRQERPAFTAAAWDVSDLPLTPPVVVRSATGTLIVEIQLQATRRRVEPVFGTVLPDLGIAMAALLTSLKSADEEVLIDGFYDGIDSPESTEFDTLIKIGPGVSRWLTSVAGEERELSTSHMTLGLFCAPSVVVRNIRMHNDEDYLPESASAIVEFQLLPGQSLEQILESLTSHVQSGPFEATVTPLLIRPPVGATEDVSLPDTIQTIRIAPGPSPASLFDATSIASVGYGLVGRDPERSTNGISIDAIAQASRFLRGLVTHLYRLYGASS